MKKLLLIVTLAVFTLAACKKNPVIPTAPIKDPVTPTVPDKSLKGMLVGKWKYMKTQGELFNTSSNSWGNYGGGEDNSSKDCYLEYKTGGSGLDHFVNSNNTIKDRIFTWSIKDEKNFFLKYDDNVNTLTYNIIKIDEHTLTYASEGVIDSFGRTVRTVDYLTK